MSVLLSKWWTEGEDGAIAVYRAGLQIPMALITALVLAQYLLLPGAREHLSFFLGCWIVFAVPLAIRHRRAAIFTKDTFIFRPVFGQLFRVPLAEIKRAYWVDWRSNRHSLPLSALNSW
jgi:hypothetical protein